MPYASKTPPQANWSKLHSCSPKKRYFDMDILFWSSATLKAKKKYEEKDIFKRAIKCNMTKFRGGGMKADGLST